MDRVLIEELEFKKDGRYYKHHECTHLFLEFRSFPASIGEDYNIRPDEIEIEETVIKIFSPTDCVRDRLASFAFFNAYECLDQAVLVAKEHEINYKKVEDWCKSENILSKYKEFIEKVKN